MDALLSNAHTFVVVGRLTDCRILFDLERLDALLRARVAGTKRNILGSQNRDE